MNLNTSNILVFLLYAIVLAFGIFNLSYELEYSSTTFLMLLFYLIVPVGLLFVISKFGFFWSHKEDFAVLFVLLAYLLFRIALNFNTNYNYQIVTWIFLFCAGYYRGYLYGEKDKRFTFPIAYIYFPYVVYVGLFSVSSILLSGYARFNIDYFFILPSIIPFVFIQNKRLYSLAAVTLMDIIAIYTVKRTLVIVVLLITVLFLSNYFIGRKKLQRRRGAIIIASIVLIIIAVRYYSVIDASLTGGLGNDRFELLSEDEGGGRTGMYMRYINLIFNGSVTDLLFGQFTGDTTGRISGFAHNDLLLITYRYGIIAFILFLSFLIKVFKILIKVVKSGSLGKSYTIASISVILTLLIVGGFNCYIDTFGYTILYLFIGILFGKYRITQQAQS